MTYTVETTETSQLEGSPVIVRSTDDSATGGILLVLLLVLVSLVVAYSVNLGNMQSAVENSSVHSEPQQAFPVAMPGPQGPPGPAGPQGAPADNSSTSNTTNTTVDRTVVQPAPSYTPVPAADPPASTVPQNP